MKNSPSSESIAPPLARPAESHAPARRAHPLPRSRAETAARAGAQPVSSAGGAAVASDRPAGELQRVRFGYFQSEANEVFLVGSFNNWNPRAHPLRRDDFGDWSLELWLPRGEHHYRLLVDGEWRDDPAAQQTAMNPFGGFDAVVVV